MGFPWFLRDTDMSINDVIKVFVSINFHCVGYNFHIVYQQPCNLQFQYLMMTRFIAQSCITIPSNAEKQDSRQRNYHSCYGCCEWRLNQSPLSCNIAHKDVNKHMKAPLVLFIFIRRILCERTDPSVTNKQQIADHPISLDRPLFVSLHWRHNERNGVSNYWRLHCLLNCWFRWR